MATEFKKKPMNQQLTGDLPKVQDNSSICLYLGCLLEQGPKREIKSRQK